jgi:DNA-binding response OmpR family regulator
MITSMFARVRVLLVDKESPETRCLEIALATKGYEVTVCHDGLSALEALYRDTFSLVILNLVLPRRSGFAVVAQLRKAMGCSTPIIAVSGLDSPRHAHYATALGANVCVPRSASFGRILDAVRQQLDSSRAWAYEELEESGIDLPQVDERGMVRMVASSTRWRNAT